MRGNRDVRAAATWLIGLAAFCSLLLVGTVVTAAGASIRPCSLILAPSTYSEGTPNAKLLSILGVLRRPQEATDVLPSPAGGGSWHLGEGVYTKYIRLARVVNGVSFYVAPIAKGEAAGCTTHEGVRLVEVRPVDGGYADGYGGYIATGHEIKSGANRQESEYVSPQGVVTASGLVPDGVARVTLRYPSKHHRRVSVTAPALANVWVTRAPEVTATEVIWFSARGRVLKTFHTA